MIRVPRSASCAYAQTNTSFYPMLLTLETCLGCTVTAHALQLRSQRPFQSRHTSTMPWEERADLPDCRQVPALPQPGQGGPDRNWAAMPANNSDTPLGRADCRPG